MANPSRPNSVPEGEPSVVVQVKQKHVERLCANQEKIRSFFSVELEPLRGADCSSLVASYKVVPVVNNNSVRKEDVDAPEESAVLATAATGHESVEDLAKRVQVRRRRLGFYFATCVCWLLVTIDTREMSRGGNLPKYGH